MRLGDAAQLTNVTAPPATHSCCPCEMSDRRAGSAEAVWAQVWLPHGCWLPPHTPTDRQADRRQCQPWAGCSRLPSAALLTLLSSSPSASRSPIPGLPRKAICLTPNNRILPPRSCTMLCPHAKRIMWFLHCLGWGQAYLHDSRYGPYWCPLHHPAVCCQPCQALITHTNPEHWCAAANEACGLSEE